MRNFNLIAVALSATALIAVTGCGGGDFAPVSGTVNYDGKPVSKLQVVFSPEPIGENYAVGPYSMGVTDENGRFTLKTRYKDPGAFIGKHQLSFEYSDISESAMSDLRGAMMDAKDSGDGEEFNKAKKKIAEMKKKLKGRPVLKGFNVTVDVPASGLDDYQLDLKDYDEAEEE
jgi:hypothetical protein